MLVLAIDDTINLDGLYFSIRRQPATMLDMLRDREVEWSPTTVLSLLSSNNTSKNSNNRHKGCIVRISFCILSNQQNWKRRNKNKISRPDKNTQPTREPQEQNN